MRGWLFILLIALALVRISLGVGRAVGPAGVYYYVSVEGWAIGQFASPDGPELIRDVIGRLVALLALWHVATALFQWRRREKGDRTALCTQCGYDLRGTLHFCRECGTNAELPLEKWR